jgi:CRP-like cAMP-binding protein
MFYILNGKYKVQGWQMKPKNKQKKLQSPEKRLYDDPDKVTEVDHSNKKHKKNLRELIPGNYFGEISVIYNCDYSATVKAMNYGTYGMLKKEYCEEMF